MNPRMAHDESFRLKEKRKAGLVTEPVNPPEPEGDK